MLTLDTRDRRPIGYARLWLALLVLCRMSGSLQASPEAYMIRFSDVPTVQSGLPDAVPQALPATALESPAASATPWLERQRWKQVWPQWPFGGKRELFFAGPHAQRYLRVDADNAFYIWTHQIEIDPQRLPFLTITWGIDRFPQNAALDLYKRNDRSIAIIVSLGSRVASAGLLPDVPRALAFFWGETETLDTLYTCVTPRQGPAEARLQCQYPHVKYIALRRGSAGEVHTDRVNLVEYFQQYFPDDWRAQQRVPSVTGVSFEARSEGTRSLSRARLYTLAFTATAGMDSPHPERSRERH